ncbi:MAG: ATP-binding cassette domain-containing protein [Euryarchaeota archaeon]
MLKITNLSKSFDKKLFDNFSLEIDPGEIVAITGPSGCGKTTLLRIICGLDNSDTGEIYVNEKLISNVPPESRNVGLIFQTPVLYPHFDVENNLRLGDKNGNIQSALKEVNLMGFEKRSIDSLSGGESQRVSIARALLAKPEILLLDEPFSSLDEELSFQLVSDIRKILKMRNCPAILVTHNIKVAENFADRIISLNK